MSELPEKCCGRCEWWKFYPGNRLPVADERGACAAPIPYCAESFERWHTKASEGTNCRCFKKREEAKCCEACVLGSGEHAEWCQSKQLFDKWDGLMKRLAATDTCPDYVLTGYVQSATGVLLPFNDDRCLCGGVGCNRCKPRGPY